MLFLPHILFVLFKPVALALDVDNGGVMQDTVKDRWGDRNVGEDLIPLGKGFVGGKDGRGSLVTQGSSFDGFAALRLYTGRVSFWAYLLAVLESMLYLRAISV